MAASAVKNPYYEIESPEAAQSTAPVFQIEPPETPTPNYEIEPPIESGIQKLAASASGIVNNVPSPFINPLKVKPADAKTPLTYPAEKISAMEEAGPRLANQAEKNIGEFAGSQPPEGMSETGRNILQTAKGIGAGAAAAAIDLAPQTPTTALEYELFGAGTKALAEGVRAGSLANQVVAEYFPKLADFLFTEHGVAEPLMNRVQYAVNQLKYKLGIPQETGLVSYAKEALAQGKISPADAARMDSDIYNSMLATRTKLPESESLGTVPPPPKVATAVQVPEPQTIPTQITPEDLPSTELVGAIKQTQGDLAPFMMPGRGIQSGTERMTLAAKKLGEAFNLTPSNIMDAMKSASTAYQDALTQGAQPDQAQAASNAAFFSRIPLLHSLSGKVDLQALPGFTDALKSGDPNAVNQLMDRVFASDPALQEAFPVVKSTPAEPILAAPQPEISAEPEFKPPTPEELQSLKEEVSLGEAGQRIGVRDGSTGEPGYGYLEKFVSQPSTFPEYFKNKGYTKDQVLNIIEKQRQGKPLTDKQQMVLEDLLNDRRAMVENFKQKTARELEKENSEFSKVESERLPLPENDEFVKEARAKGLSDARIMQKIYTDKLTGAWNRAYAEEMGYIDRPQIFFDIDKFKSVNDTYGHPVGDKVLRDVVDMAIDSGLKIARFGGEEFQVFPNENENPLEFAQAFADFQNKLRRYTVKDNDGKDLFTGIKLSAGFGHDLKTADDFAYKVKRARGDNLRLDKLSFEAYNAKYGTGHEWPGDTETYTFPRGVAEALPDERRIDRRQNLQSQGGPGSGESSEVIPTPELPPSKPQETSPSDLNQPKTEAVNLGGKIQEQPLLPGTPGRTLPSKGLEPKAPQADDLLGDFQPKPEQPEFTIEPPSAQGNGPSLKSEIIPGTKEFVESDLIPAIKTAGDALAAIGDDVRKTFAPVVRSETARIMGGVLRENAARLAQSKERVYASLKKASEAFDPMPKEAKYDFIDKMESGQSQTQKELQPLADQLRKLLDDRRKQIQSLGTGKLEHFIENYFPHIWEDPKAASNVFARVFGKKPLEGPKSFLKERTIDTFKEGLEKGLKPVTDNPVDLALLKIHEMDRYIMGQNTFNEMKDQGLAKHVRFGEKPPEGYAKLDDKIARTYGNPNIPIKEAFDQKIMDGLNEVAKDIGITHERLAKIGGRRWGLAWPSGDIHTKFAGPESVLAHEIGHQLDFKYGLKDKLVKTSPYREELRKLSDQYFEGETTPSYMKYLRKGEEKMAHMLEAYIHAPEIFKKVAPKTFEYFDNFIKTHSELKKLSEIKPSLILGVGQNTVHAGGLVVTGEYYAPEGAAKVINNYLSPGLKGNVVYDVFRGAGNILNQAQLGLSAFHLAFVSMDANISKTALGIQQLSRGEVIPSLKSIGSGIALVKEPFETYLKGDKVLKEYFAPGSQGQDVGAMVDNLIKAGGRVKMDSFYKNSAVESFWKALRSGNYVGAGIRMPGATLEAIAKPIMENIVPRMKLGVFADLARFSLSTLGPDATENDVRNVLGQAWDSVDNRLGQVVYDNLFWKKAVKDLGLASVRSLGWNLGTFRELGGGALDILRQGYRGAKGEKPEVTSRMGYLVALPLLTGIYGALYQKLKTGEGPRELKDYFFPRTGEINPDGSPERVSLPTYMKDIYAYYKAPIKTISHKLHPMISAISQMLSNEDYYGTEIRHADDPMVKQAKDTAEFAVKQFEPFSFRNYERRIETGGTKGQAVQSFFGVTPAPASIDRTDTQERISELLKAKGTPIKTKEQFDAGVLKRNVLEKVRSGQESMSEAGMPLEGQFSMAQLRSLAKRTHLTGLQDSFKQLALPDALLVYDKATPEEKDTLTPIMTRKMGNGLKGIPPLMRQGYVDRFERSKPK